MLWIVEGDDISKKNKALQTIKDKVSPDQVTRYDSVSPEVLSLKDFQDLFSETRMVVVTQANVDDFEKELASLHTSHVFFVFFIEKLLVSQKKILKDVNYIDCSEIKISTQPRFNVFSISDAFALKNKKDLWVMYQKALKQGVSEQEIISIVLWQTKALLLALKTDQKKSGLKPFVFSKAQKSLKLFTQTELEGYMERLVSMYHDARRGKDLSAQLERFVLSI